MPDLQDTSGVPIVEDKITPENLLTQETLGKVDPVWSKFKSELKDKFGFQDTEMELMDLEFKRCLGALETLNKGEQLGEWHFEENRLRYHDFNHTLNMVRRTLQILPGFLEDLSTKGVDVRTNLSRIKGLIYGSIFHEIGYLKRVKGDEVYSTQGELYFDHVDRSIDFAPAILREIGIDLPINSEAEYFLTRMIRATDFNMSWVVKEKQEGLTGEIKEWGQVLEAADFLAAFSHKYNIPSIVWDLYWENLSRIVQNGKVMRFQRYKGGDWVGKIRFGEDEKPILEESDDAENDYARILEYKFGKPPIDKPPQEIISPSLYKFVSSNFLSIMQNKLEPYLQYTDQWFGKETNEVRENYTMNIRRVDTLRELVEVREVDPLAIFEGAFSGYDLRLWTEELMQQEMLDESFTLGIAEDGEKATWHKTDRRVLHGNGFDVIGRLVTKEIRQILAKVKDRPDFRIKAVKLLLERYQGKLEGENVSDVYLTFAPKAYVGFEDGPFQSTGEAMDTFIEAVKRLEEKEGLPKIHLICCIRRDRDFMSDTEEEKMLVQREYAQTISERKNDLAGIAVFGSERTDEGGVTKEYALNSVAGVLDNLASDIPVIALVGQTFPGTSETDKNKAARFMKNMSIFVQLQEKFKKLVLWGGQDIMHLSPEELSEFKAMLAGREISWIHTGVYDQETGLVKKNEPHPFCRLLVGLCDGRQFHGTGNPVIGVGASSVTLSALRHNLNIGIDEGKIKSKTEEALRRSTEYPLHVKD